jgi:hypothetical protein
MGLPSDIQMCLGSPSGRLSLLGRLCQAHVSTPHSTTPNASIVQTMASQSCQVKADMKAQVDGGASLDGTSTCRPPLQAAQQVAARKYRVILGAGSRWSGGKAACII